MEFPIRPAITGAGDHFFGFETPEQAACLVKPPLTALTSLFSSFLHLISGGHLPFIQNIIKKNILTCLSRPILLK
jgi:hypothetical protein